MCGIAAIVKSEATNCPASVLDQIRDEVAHRGPDGQGRQFFAKGLPLSGTAVPSTSAWDVALGHRRLSILDLTPAGQQPMVYCGRFWIVYNGEV